MAFREYPYLKTHPTGVYHADLLADLASDSVSRFRTGVYYNGNSFGGATYDVRDIVDAEDGGSVIHVGGKQLDALFGDTTSIQQFGAFGDNRVDDWAAIDSCLKYVKANITHHRNQRPRIIEIHPSIYKTTQTLEMLFDDDVSLGATIRGVGDPKSCQIWNQNPLVPNFHIGTTLGNCRALLMENFRIRGGSIGLKLDKVLYSKFNQLSFGQQRDVGLEVFRGTNNVFTNSDFIETVFDTMRLTQGAGDMFIGTQVGEFSGNILISATRATFVGGKMYDSWDRVTTAGLNSMGPALFTVGASGSLNVMGMTLSVARNLVNTTNFSDIFFANNTITWGADVDGHLVSMYGNSRNAGIGFVNNRIDLRSRPVTVSLFEKALASADFEHCQFLLNRISGSENATLQLDDDLINSSLGNQMDLNTIT